MLDEFIRTVNWKTTGFAIGYLICSAVGSFFPGVAEACNLLDKVLIAGGIISAADAGRVQNIVRATDQLLWKSKLDPATLAPLELIEAAEKK